MIDLLLKSRQAINYLYWILVKLMTQKLRIRKLTDASVK